PFAVFVRGVAYDAREISHYKNDLMAKLLKIPQFQQRNGAAYVNIRTCRVNAEFYTQPLTAQKLFLKIICMDDFFNPPGKKLLHLLWIGIYFHIEITLAHRTYTNL